jgi:copper chaperone CopZ
MITEQLDGVGKVFVSYDDKKGSWEYDDSKVSKEDIVKVIEELGYKAQ